ncbi:hypothetical protein AVEN_270522-1 [Araneus ventricosus]|uniref:ATP-dependent DNA helicase PIF1 n=1 Tax=Araneus ventricosus TaxID=182803 RepID=A0A4Y2B4X4_ARAVE|nr:hypothetical protein AVEN_270522-1 [Araneus ventricosus]
MLLCRFSHVEGCSQNALCCIMQRSAVCASTWAICCGGKIKPFQVRWKWAAFCEKQDLFPFPAAWMSRNFWQDVKYGPPVSSSSQSDCRSSIIFILKIDFKKEIGSLTDGVGQGESVFIPRIPLIPSDYPFQFKRLQFPVKVCCAMTINKAQGQSLKMADVHLRTDFFSLGQLYVACSRVRSSDSLVLLQPQGKTANVVYKEAFNLSGAV